MCTGLKMKDCVCKSFVLFLLRFLMAVSSKAEYVTFSPYDPVTTRNSVTLRCIASKNIMVTHGSDIRFQTDNSNWVQHDVTDKDGNPYVNINVTKNGNMSHESYCRVKVHEDQFNATTNVYFLNDENDPVVVEEKKDVHVPCMSDTAGVNHDLKCVWQVNGKPIIPDDMFERIEKKDNHTLVLKETESQDTALNISCTVVSKRSLENFYSQNISKAIKDNAAQTFQKNLSVLHFEKHAEQNYSVYDVKIHGFDRYELQWLVNDSETSNSTSVNVSSAIPPTLVVTFNGRSLWNATVHFDAHADNKENSDSSTNEYENDMDPGITVAVVVVVIFLLIVGLVIGISCCRRRQQHVTENTPTNGNQDTTEGNKSGDLLLGVSNGAADDDNEFVDTVESQE